jgi:hypothetical protein
MLVRLCCHSIPITDGGDPEDEGGVDRRRIPHGRRRVAWIERVEMCGGSQQVQAGAMDVLSALYLVGLYLWSFPTSIAPHGVRRRRSVQFGFDLADAFEEELPNVGDSIGIFALLQALHNIAKK